MDLSWDDMRTVLSLVRCGSLAGAAQELGVNYTTVSRRIRRAEQTLGRVLFERLKDGYEPTAAAHFVAKNATEMEKTAHGLLRGLGGLDDGLQGDFTLTAPQLLISCILSPVIRDFSRAYPEVSLHIRATNDLLDLSRREADLAIRISRAPGDSLMGLRLTEQHSASFAAPEWAERIALDPQAPIDWLSYAGYDTLPNSVRINFPASRIALRFDDMVAMQGAAVAGLGVVRMPMFLGRSTPGLVQVPLLEPQPYADIWVVGHPDIWPSAKLAAFRDILVPFIRSKRALFVA
ncbi:LysR family transcriptional regulator [Pelagimonas varians]|uniref:HTH-type transcriptional activator AmpR n=2 Tax=Pelagimonas varians TaxID=696760 RepID=A0A238K1Q7_9RHOB|nr:LysR family transcriptional regulator [Pelagimonas varians]SMX36042.1 HTH-type transcriptional activator AmpR [Pelagimonas varians]